MKPKKYHPFRSSVQATLTAAIVLHFTAHSLQAQTTRYWDQNGTTAGFGAATGTWTDPTASSWSTSNAGTETPGASITTLISDPLHFGTDTTGTNLGLTTGTITVTGTVNAASLSFGSAQTANITLSGGIINLAPATTIHVGSGTPTHTITSQITGAATSLTKTGNTLRLSGSNTYTGSTIISAGTLILGNTNTLGTTPGTNGTSGISMAAGTTLQSGSATGSDNTIAAPITLSGAGNTTLSVGTGAVSTTTTFTLNGAIGGTTGNLVFNTGTNSYSNGSSVFVLNAASTYTGNTLITTGNGGNNPVFVKNGIANALPTTTVLTFAQVNGGGTGRTFQYDLNGKNQTLAGLENGGVVPQVRNMRVTSTAAAELTINNTADYTFGGSTTATTVGTAGSVNRAQITGAIALTKSGAGTFTLGGTLAGGASAGGNTFTGDTKILGGILTLGETLSLQNSAFDTANSITGDATNGLRTTVTTLRFAGLTGNKNFADIFTSTTGGYTGLTALTLNPGTGVTNSYAGDIGDGATGLTLTKSGAGTQILTGANTHTGGTTIANNGGTLRIAHAGALGAGAVSIPMNGTNTGNLELALTGTNTITNTFNGFNSAFTLTNTGNAQIVNTSGTNEITSDLTVVSTGGNGLNVESNGGLLNLSGTITSTVTAGPRTLSLGGSGNGLVSGVIENDTANSFSFAVIKSGAGTWSLSNVTTYTGNTTVAGGTLALTSTGSLAFAIGSSGVNNKISGISSANLILDGSFTFDLTSAGTVLNDSWNIVDVANLTESYGSNFNVVGFAADGGGDLWNGTANGADYQFSKTSGMLTVIPEPSALLLSALGGLLVLRRRR